MTHSKASCGTARNKDAQLKFAKARVAKRVDEVDERKSIISASPADLD